MTLSKILLLSVAAAILIFWVGTADGKVFPSQRPVKAREWTKTARVWTARSCVGEAGFEAIEECMAIAWVYATRATENKKAYLWIVKRYSAAVKKHSTHKRPWILQLNHTMEKPKDWPKLKWGVHKHLWRKMLQELDKWSKGLIPNPVPGANHYGSQVDARRAKYVRRWKRLEAPGEFKNWFFNSKEKTGSRIRPTTKPLIFHKPGQLGIIY